MESEGAEEEVTARCTAMSALCEAKPQRSCPLHQPFYYRHHKINTASFCLTLYLTSVQKPLNLEFLPLYNIRLAAFPMTLVSWVLIEHHFLYQVFHVRRQLRHYYITLILKQI